MCYPMKECRDLIPIFMDERILFLLWFHIFSSPTSLSLFPSQISPNRTFYLEIILFELQGTYQFCYKGYILQLFLTKRGKNHPEKTHFPHLGQSYGKKKRDSRRLSRILPSPSNVLPYLCGFISNTLNVICSSYLPVFFRQTYPSLRIRISDRSTTPEQHEHVTIRTCRPSRDFF